MCQEIYESAEGGHHYDYEYPSLSPRPECMYGEGDLKEENEPSEVDRQYFLANSHAIESDVRLTHGVGVAAMQDAYEIGESQRS